MFSSSTSPINTREPTFTMNWQCKITHYNDSHKIFLRTFTIANRLSATIPTWVRRIWFRTKYWLRGGAESAHVICILSNKYFHTAKIQKINYISKKYGRNVSCLVQTSFRFHLTSIDDGQNADTLTLGYAIPAVRGHWGLAPVRHYSCRAYQKWDAPSQVHPTAHLNNQ